MATISRRTLLQSAAAAGLTIQTNAWSKLLAAPENATATGPACIMIFLEGGPSHHDTFDPKPGTSVSGPFQPIETAIPGVKFSEHLPKLAAAANKLAIIRSMTSVEGDHERANSLLHTGYLPTPRLAYPHLGATLSREWQDAARDVPLFVSIGPTTGPGILGPQFGPFVIDDVNNPAPALELQEGLSDTRIRRRLQTLAAMNDRFAAQTQHSLPTDLTKLTQRADRMRGSSVFRPYDPATEDAALFEKYGGAINDGYLARACLLARRLVESGVRFVEIQYSGWDTHGDNFNQVQNLSGPLDAGLATLVEDLEQRGLLAQTLVMCLGEFGRTPKINGDNGRDHHPDAFSAVLAGGGLKVGQVVGASDEHGAQVQDRPVTIADLHATVYSALGLDIARDYFAPDGRLLKLTNKGQPVPELL